MIKYPQLNFHFFSYLHNATCISIKHGWLYENTYLFSRNLCVETYVELLYVISLISSYHEPYAKFVCGYKSYFEKIVLIEMNVILIERHRKVSFEFPTNKSEP